VNMMLVLPMGQCRLPTRTRTAVMRLHHRWTRTKGDSDFATSQPQFCTEPRPLLILDLDETLIHAADVPLGRAPDFRVGPYFVYRRPGLDEFLSEVRQAFQLAIWSSSGSEYLHLVVSEILPADLRLEFLWGRERCVYRFDGERHETYFVKDLKKAKRRGFDLARTLVVDDSPEKLERNYGNAIYIKPYLGTLADRELQRLSQYLRTFAGIDDVRRVEKRGWRQQVVLDHDS